MRKQDRRSISYSIPRTVNWSNGKWCRQFIDSHFQTGLGRVVSGLFIVFFSRLLFFYFLSVFFFVNAKRVRSETTRLFLSSSANFSKRFSAKPNVTDSQRENNGRSFFNFVIFENFFAKSFSLDGPVDRFPFQTGSLMEYTEFYLVLPSFTQFHRVLPSFTQFYRVLPSLTQFYRVLPSFTQFYLVLPSFTEFNLV